MREILFRGKRLDNGEWLEGYLFHDVDSGETEIQFMQYETDDFGVDCWRNGYEVDPETVGQFTGLTDKKGKKIFEGDIVRAHFRTNHSKQTFRVIFEDGMFLFDNKCVEVPKYDIYGMEIIGNIHKNPELLEG